MDSELSTGERGAFDTWSDSALLSALHQGQVSALDVLYGRYAQQVYSLAYKILASREEAEDLTQEIFVSFWQADAYQPNRGSLKSFLMMLTRSRAIDKLRRRGTGHRFLQRWQRLSSTSDDNNLPMDQASMKEQSSVVQQALSQLSESERQILEISYYKGVSQSEIAKHLNLPLGTVKSRSRQALKKLRQYLQSLHYQR